MDGSDHTFVTFLTRHLHALFVLRTITMPSESKTNDSCEVDYGSDYHYSLTSYITLNSQNLHQNQNVPA